MKSNNATGFKCVYISGTASLSYEYRFTFKGKLYFKGSFKTPEEASEAYRKAYLMMLNKSYCK